MVMAASCENELSNIGSSLAQGEATITIDSIDFNLNGKSVEYKDFDAKTGNLLLGNLHIPEYGRLNCSFVTRMMCSSALGVPDSLMSPDRVDSCKLVIAVSRGNLTGDSLAPMKATAYRLTRQLPSDITNAFNPEGYYDKSSLIGSRNYTISCLGRSDSSFVNTDNIRIDIDMPTDFGKQVFKEYIENPSTFEWPQSFAQYFPGLFVETSFGKGCVANVHKVGVTIYYHHLEETTTTNEDEEKITTVTHVMDSVIPFMTSPEVLSSNNIRYEVSDSIKRRIAEGETIITTPGGYVASFKFPAEEIISRYQTSLSSLTTVGDLLLSLPAEKIENGYDLPVVPSLLLIKTSEINDFFANNKLPDGKSAFTAYYSSSNDAYQFSSMRSYLLDLMKKDTITDEDVDFTLIPVQITTETVNSTYTSQEYVTKCVPYTIKPTMTRLLTEKALIIFSFTNQVIE